MLTLLLCSLGIQAQTTAPTSGSTQAQTDTMTSRGTQTQTAAPAGE